LEKRHVGASGGEWAFSPMDRCLIAGRAVWFYAMKLVYPHPLIFIYPRWRGMSLSQSPWLAAFPLAAIGAFISLWLLRGKIGRGPLVAVLFFAGTLLPALGFINVFPMRYSFVADHFQYHAGIGLILLFAAGLRRLPIIVNAAILAILGSLTWQQGYIYQNQLVLWKDTSTRNPAAWIAWCNLGDEYVAQSNLPGLSPDNQSMYRQMALDCYSEFYNLAPWLPMAHLKWGLMLQYDGNLHSAWTEFRTALALAPTDTSALNDMAVLLTQMRDSDQAMAYFHRTIALDPTNAEIRVSYAQALVAIGKIDEAKEQCNIALQINPDLPDAKALWTELVAK
jgi:tetratricopeptide (TPR) repeat protein